MNKFCDEKGNLQVFQAEAIVIEGRGVIFFTSFWRFLIFKLREIIVEYRSNLILEVPPLS